MSLMRTFARKVMGHFAVPLPKRDRTLRIYAPPRTVPDLRLQCLCHVVAKRYWRLAHEHRCTRIVIHRPPNHVHRFDTIDLMRAHVRALGWWPARPERIRGVVPRRLATAHVLAAGDELDTARGFVPGVAFTAVSGGAPGSKET